VYKLVGNRCIEKRFNLRVPHVRHSPQVPAGGPRPREAELRGNIRVEAKEKGGESVSVSILILHFQPLRTLAIGRSVNTGTDEYIRSARPAST
jgi:hypothetical protein